MHGLAWLGLVLAVFCVNGQPELVFKLGSVMKIANDVPQCPGTGAMMQAFQVPIERLNRGIGHGVDGLITKATLKDRIGQEFRIKFDYVNREPSACITEVHDKEVERLISEDQAHIILGNTHFAFSEAKIVNEAKRLTYHCCYEKDDLFKKDYQYIYGIANLAKTETHQILTSIALEDSITKLFVFYTEDFRYATQACENAVDYASSQLRRVSSGIEIVKVLKYSTANISSNPTFFQSVVAEEAVQSGATAVLGCDSSVNGFVIAKALQKVKNRLKAVFLTLSPAHPSFGPIVGPGAAEHVLTSALWHPLMLGRGDSFFGSPIQYADAFEVATGSRPYWVTALASNTIVSLIFAIQSAFEGCKFLDPANLNVDSLLFDPDALECGNVTGIVQSPGLAVTGYDLLLKSLAAQSMTTFFGDIEFNHFRRNIANEPVVLQVQNSVQEIVLPLEQASSKLIMPIPHPVEEPHVGALEEDIFIVVVVVVIAGTLFLLAALLLVFFYRQQHAEKIESLLTIEPEQLEIINLPVQLGNSWESGKARLHNTLVALEPLIEIKFSAPGETNMQKKSTLIKPLGSWLSKADPKPFDMDSEATHVKLSELDLESLQHEDSSNKGSVHGGSINGGSAHGGSVNGGSVHGGSVLNGAPAQREPPITIPSKPIIQSMTSTTVPSLSTIVPTSKKDKPRSSALSNRQVLDLVWRSKNLQHPSVVPVTGVMWALPGMPANTPVLVTECCELGSLTSVLENETMELDHLKQMDISKDLACALAYLHALDQPKLSPALTSKLCGVHLNKLVRAKLRVPLTSFLPRPCSHGSQRTGHELQDVYQFGLGITQLHTVGPRYSSSGACDKPMQMVEGCAMTVSAYWELERSRGCSLAVLLRECCSIDPNSRPTFTQIVQRLEAMEPEVAHVAQHSSDELVVPTSVPEAPDAPMTCSRSRRRSMQNKGKKGADSLLYELFPAKVADALKAGRFPEPEPFSSVSLFFSDVVGYTDLCSKLAPEEIMDMLHRLYSRFDTLAQSLRLFKLETIGDAYMCASNLLHPDPEAHAAQMAAFAFGACAAANQVPVCESHPELGNIHIRVGIHAGPVMGAVVGILNRRFCLFGDTVNVASRMESTSTKDMIQCSASFMDLLQQQWPEAAKLAVPQGLKPIKGKGTMNTFFLYPPQRAPLNFAADDN